MPWLTIDEAVEIGVRIFGELMEVMRRYLGHKPPVRCTTRPPARIFWEGNGSARDEMIACAKYLSETFDLVYVEDLLEENDWGFTHKGATGASAHFHDRRRLHCKQVWSESCAFSLA
ncbi:hypothetical protein SAMN03159341_13634 [Paenibacillus sp. 1_12]|nr:hypothetical protein SAMN03159341_13634 [Paenibacillus sp. 1_12]